jgi:uncharacterized Rmd1/YagE family protein
MSNLLKQESQYQWLVGTFCCFLGFRNFSFNYSNSPSKKTIREHQKTIPTALNTHETNFEQIEYVIIMSTPLILNGIITSRAYGSHGK